MAVGAMTNSGIGALLFLRSKSVELHLTCLTQNRARCSGSFGMNRTLEHELTRGVIADLRILPDLLRIVVLIVAIVPVIAHGLGIPMPGGESLGRPQLWCDSLRSV